MNINHVTPLPQHEAKNCNCTCYLKEISAAQRDILFNRIVLTQDS